MATPDYSGSTWYGAYSGNYTPASRPSSNPINKIVVHVTQGSWSSAINWFKDSRAGVSAHYTVRSSDGFVGQSVQEKDIAYHAGYWPYNQTSIGIEHEGYVSDPKWFTEAMYRSSARLSAYLCNKYKIPIDRSHIIGHNEVPNATHTDPGGNWNWTTYMEYVRSYAGVTVAAPYEQVVDNATSGRFSAGSNWLSSSYEASGNYGTTHRYLKPGSTFAPAQFKVNAPARAAYDVYGWWPASTGYNDRTRFRVYTVNGWVSKEVNQRTNGGTWVLLGRYTLNAGDAYRIQVSNQSAGSGYIVADAVKIVRT